MSSPSERLKGLSGSSLNGRPAERRVRLTPASTIRPRPVYWTWQDRLPVGEVCLTPGRGGVGKSTFHAWVIARLTRGQLPGTYEGTPRPCIIATAEDSWARTVVPRLIAAGANLDLVFRAEVVTEEDDEVSLALPRDCSALEAEIAERGVALLSLDPLMSAISGGLDTHKDREVREALEPLARLADRTGCTILGNAHFRKASASDPLMMAMGSAAFANVVRAALGFARDVNNDGEPLEDGSCVISQIKNNLGRLDLPSIRYRIEPTGIDTEEGPAEVGRFVVVGDTTRSVADVLGHPRASEERTERDEAADWLVGYLTDAGGKAPRASVMRDGEAAGFTAATLNRAKAKAGIDHETGGFPRRSVWTLPQSSQGVLGDDQGAMTATAHPEQGKQASQDAESVQSSQGSEPEMTEAHGEPL